jgi:hypothetical protein
MPKKLNLSTEKKKEIASYLSELYSVAEMNDRDMSMRIDEYWNRNTGQWSAKKDKSFPWKGSADIQTGIVQYSVAGIEARYSSAINSIQFCSISSQVSEASNNAAKNAQNWINNFWRHKSSVNNVLLEAFQYETVEGTFFIQIVPDVSKKKVKKFSFKKMISNIKNIALQPIVGKDGEMQTEDKTIDDFIAARWVNVPRRLIKFDNSVNHLSKCHWICIEFEKSPAEIYELSKRKENPWYSVDKILKSTRPNDMPEQKLNANEQDMSEQTKNDYIGYIHTLTSKKAFRQWWLSYNIGTSEAPGYRDMSFITSKDTSELVYDEENSFFDKRKPIVSGPCRRIAGRIDGQGIPMYIGSLNDAIDTLIDQALDNNTLANTVTGTAIPQPGFDPDKVTIQPGKWYPVKAHDNLKQWVFSNRLPDIAALEGILQGFIERKSLVSDYSLGRESQLNKHPTMRGTAMLLQEYGLNLDPLMQNTQEALKEALKQTLQCAYEFMPEKGITYSYQDKETQEYKQGTLTRADLEYLEDWDIAVLQGAVDVMTNAEKQNAMQLFQTLGQDQTGEVDTFFVKENLAEKLAPRDKNKVMRSPKEQQAMQMMKQKAGQLQQAEQMMQQKSQRLAQQEQALNQRAAGEKAQIEEKKFLHELHKTNMTPEEKALRLAAFRKMYLQREMAQVHGVNPDEMQQPEQQGAPQTEPAPQGAEQ